MTLNNQVPSLELSKKLDALLGDERKVCLFSWQAFEGVWRLEYPTCENDWRYADESIPTYTVAELGCLLNDYKKYDFFRAYIEVTKSTHLKIVHHAEMALKMMTDPNIGAQMLIYLLENKVKI